MGLTVIIAFSQGLEDLLKRRGQLDEQADQAIGGIEQIARESLDNTRSMLDWLNAGDAVGEDADDATGSEGAAENDVVDDLDRLHQWDDARPVFERVRSLGVMLVFTETGRRSNDRVQENLCFRVTRECITNALRHTDGLTRISVAWDHGERGMNVIIRNDGISAGMVTADAIDGTGLRILSEALAARGGSLLTRIVEGQWDVRAFIPQAARETDDE
jgi:signal transduction histidine kinase